jgi:C4-dicarboxylate-specific signal transduction histidine kinase
MKFANESFFLVCALLLGGLFISALPYFRKNKLSFFNYYWLIALGLHVSAYVFFAIASSTSFALLTLANTFFCAGYFFLALFCASINQKSVKKISFLSPVFFILFALIFEYLRQSGTFQARVAMVVCTLLALLLWMLLELFALRKRERDAQLDFLIFTTGAELVLGTIRLWLVLSTPTVTSINLYEEPFISSILRWLAISFTALSYISITGLWAERLTQDNLRITGLLQEREALIANLLKANKTTATGALSASIAHELNQPLGASNLNIQFLRMKLEKGLLSPELVKEVLDTLEVDNNRAANIVRSLRSIFTDSQSQTQECDLNDLVTNVLEIVKPELKSQQIQIQLRLDQGLSILVNASEIEQVILNLLNNAIQSLASSEGGDRQITIEASRDGQLIRMKISDNGIGVPAEFKSSLFELLNTTKNSGMGLGLWLCKHIITRYDGRIWHEDASEKGATFILELPPAP